MKSYGQNKISAGGSAWGPAWAGLEAGGFCRGSGLEASLGRAGGRPGYLPVTRKSAISAEKRPEKHQIGGEIKGIWPWERKGR